MTPQEAEAALERLEIFNWATFLAAFLFGLTTGWNIAFHWYYSKIKKARPKPDPLRLTERKTVLVPHKAGDKITGWTEIQVVPDREAT